MNNPTTPTTPVDPPALREQATRAVAAIQTARQALERALAVDRTRLRPEIAAREAAAARAAFEAATAPNLQTLAQVRAAANGALAAETVEAADLAQVLSLDASQADRLSAVAALARPGDLELLAAKIAAARDRASAWLLARLLDRRSDLPRELVAPIFATLTSLPPPTGLTERRATLYEVAAIAERAAIAHGEALSGRSNATAKLKLGLAEAARRRGAA